MSKKNIKIDAVDQYLEALSKFHVEEVLNGLRKEGLLPKLSSKSQPIPEEVKTTVDETATTTTSTTTKTEPTENISDLVQNVHNLTDIIRSVYGDIHNISGATLNDAKTHAMVKSFADKKWIDIPAIDSSVVRESFNDHLLLRDPEIQKDVTEKLDIKTTYFPIINSLLENFAFEKVKVEFAGYEVVRNESRDNNPDITAVDKSKVDPDLLFEVLYRKRSMVSLRDDLTNAINRLINYERENMKEACMILLNFSDGGSEEISKLRFRFQQLIEDSYPTFKNRIFLIALYVKNAHLLKDELVKLQGSLQTGGSNLYEFQLTSQQTIKGYPGLDDAVYEKVFNVSKYSYEITFKPDVEIMPYWRFGLMFAKSETFKDRSPRHDTNYPIFHLTKNSEPNPVQLLHTLYTERADVVFEGVTQLSNYRNEPLTITVAYDGNEGAIDVLTRDRKSILERPIGLDQFFAFKILAWADSRNHFAFKVTVKEKALRLPKATAVQMDRSIPTQLIVTVLTQESINISGAHVVVLQENNTHHEGKTIDGKIQFSIPATTQVTILVAHPDYLCAVVDNIKSDKDIVIMLKQHPGGGSLICANGTGHIPGLKGRLNPILDSSQRKYLYADNIAIDGGKTQPVYFEIDQPTILTDNNYKTLKVFFRLIRGRTSILDYIP